MELSECHSDLREEKKQMDNRKDIHGDIEKKGDAEI